MGEYADLIFIALIGLGLIAVVLVVRAVIRWSSRSNPMKF